jgi:formylglycine-generating enzyme required for sulfatase activity
VSDFELDEFEVTVGRFRGFVAAFPAHRPGAGSGKNPNDPNDLGWDPSWNAALPDDLAADVSYCGAPFQTWTDVPAGNETRPINCLSWYVAQAFCIYDGGRLATQAEWNYAAAGGAQQRYYPWSFPPSDQTIDPTYASYSVDDTRQCFGDGIAGCALTDLVPVGSKANGYARWGQADLSGNVAEWVQDFFAQPLPTPCQDCATLSGSSFRVFIGGSFDRNAFNLGLNGFSSTLPTARAPNIGARCARQRT